MSKATGPKYVVKFRRRRTGVTDYSARLGMLKSRDPRLVARTSNKGVLAQVISLDKGIDKVIVSADSKELKQFGWLPKRNSPTAYLVGFLTGKKAKEKGVGAVILDVGRVTSTRNNLVYMVAKGIQDSGVECPIGEEMVDDSRFNGSHIEAYAKSLSDEDRKKKFSEYYSAKIDVSSLVSLFEKVKSSISK